MGNTCVICGKEITGMCASRRKACAGACTEERTRRYWQAMHLKRWKDPAHRARSLERNNYHFHHTPKYRDRHRNYMREYMRGYRKKRRAAQRKARRAQAAPNNAATPENGCAE